MTFLKRGWVLLVVVVALIVGGVAVVRLNGVFPGPVCPSPIRGMRPRRMPPRRPSTKSWDRPGRQASSTGWTRSHCRSGPVSPRCRGRRRSWRRCPASSPMSWPRAMARSSAAGSPLTAGWSISRSPTTGTRRFPAWTSPRERRHERHGRNPRRAPHPRRTQTSSGTHDSGAGAADRAGLVGARGRGQCLCPAVGEGGRGGLGAAVAVGRAVGDRDEAHRGEVQGVRLRQPRAGDPGRGQTPRRGRASLLRRLGRKAQAGPARRARAELLGQRFTSSGVESYDHKSAYVQVNLRGDQGGAVGDKSVAAIRKIVADSKPPAG